MSVLKQAQLVLDQNAPEYKATEAYPRDLLKYLIALELKKREAIRTLEEVIKGQVDLDDICAVVSGVNKVEEVSRETLDSLLDDWRES